MDVLQIIFSIFTAFGVPSIMTILLNRVFAKKDGKATEIKSLRESLSTAENKNVLIERSVTELNNVDKELKEKIEDLSETIETLLERQDNAEEEIMSLKELMEKVVEMQNSYEKTSKVMMNTQRVMLNNDIMEAYNKHMKNKFMTLQDRQTFSSMVKSYIEAGGEEMTIKFVYRIYELPTEPQS